MRLLFDIETDGLLDKVTKVHCIVTRDLDTGVISRFNTNTDYGIEDGLAHLELADELYGHNIIDYDLRVLRKLHDWYPAPSVTLRDTLVISRLIWTNLQETDWKLKGSFPTDMIGKHSLKAWGYRLGVRKGTYGETTDWKEWTPQLEEYCVQDLEVNYALIQKIESLNYSQQAIELEMEFAAIISEMTAHGFRFDSEAAGRLYAQLVEKRDALVPKLRTIFPPTYVEMKSPQYWEVSFTNDDHEGGLHYPTKGLAQKAVRQGGWKNTQITKGPNKVKEILFNPSSRDEIARRLMEKGWVPTELTDTGKPEISDETLEAIGTPEAKQLAEYMLLQKRIGQLATGKQALMGCVRGDRIHGKVNTNGCVTGRCSHFSPNLAQVPKPTSPYGPEFRSLFLPDKGHVLVGADASGLELRVLGHFLARYDNGEYADVVVNGDVHTKNQQVFGYPPGKAWRDKAKTTIYAKLYGAGGEKLGTIAGVAEEEIEEFKKDTDGWDRVVEKLHKDKRQYDDRTVATILKGEDIGSRLLSGIPAFACLSAAVSISATDPEVLKSNSWKAQWIKKKYREWVRTLRDAGFPVPKPLGYLRGIDKRILHVRSPHAAMNTVFQSAGALIMKMAVCLWYRKCIAKGWKCGPDFAAVVMVHDELQFSSRPEIAEESGEMFVQSITEAGEFFGFRVKLAGEYKIGANWFATH